MKIGNVEFDLNERTYIMGILNITPDSFSDGGKYNGVDKALKQVEKMVLEGADLLDIGGESTRPEHDPVTQTEELSRVIPVIEAIRKNFDLPLSIDTYKAVVAEEAIKAGVNLINDVWGFKADPDIAAVAAKYDVACCLMHNRDNREYSNFVLDVIEDLWKSIHIAEQAGVKNEKIIIDPGIGFAKNYEENLIMINNLEHLHGFGYPVLLGTSRKRFIGEATKETLPENRDIGTVATTVVGIMKGCRFIRVHNVGLNKKAAMMADSLVKNNGA